MGSVFLGIIISVVQKNVYTDAKNRCGGNMYFSEIG